MAYPNGGSYCVSKFALYGMTKVFREELKPFGIKVTALLPGATLTESWAGTELPESRFMQPDRHRRNHLVGLSPVVFGGRRGDYPAASVRGYWVKLGRLEYKCLTFRFKIVLTIYLIIHKNSWNSTSA